MCRDVIASEAKQSRAGRGHASEIASSPRVMPRGSSQ
jgi:hypothetical protein